MFFSKEKSDELNKSNLVLAEDNQEQDLVLSLKEAREELAASKSAILNLLEDVNLEKEKIEDEVKKRTEELRNEKAILRSTIDSLPLAYFLINNNFLLIENNKLLPKVFDLKKIESFADMSSQFTGDFDLREKCSFAMEKDEATIFEDVKIGNKFFKIYLQPILLNGDKNKVGLLGLLEDETSSKILQRSRDEFFSIASHELRTPLTAIMGNTSMLIDDFFGEIKSEDARQMIKDIHEASNRLLKIVADFLDVSRIELGKIIIKQESVNLKNIIEDVVKDIDTVAKEKGIFVSYKDDGLEYNAFADTDKVKQIIYNLVGNAINYTHTGGVEIYLNKEGSDKVSVFVKDSGVGILPENKPLLFRKFQQAQEKLLTRDATQSTGLGLYISRLLAKAMSGDVQLVESTPGKGSLFKLVLPVKM